MKSAIIVRLLTGLMLAFPVASDACTGLKLSAKDGSCVHGRTFEFGIQVDTSVVVIPQGYTFTASTPLGAGMTYQTKYASVGTICFNEMAIMDGMNEQGLSIGTFYFPGYARYTLTTSKNRSHSLSPIDFPNWILSQFATLAEVEAALKNVVIAPTVIKGWGNTPPEFHYIVYDKAGKSLVIEPVYGKLIVHDNPLGTITNSPTFDWHMTNLRNFINLTVQNVPPIEMDNLKLAPFGQGSGMVGLPGDFTPPSRFVRAAIFSMAATPSSTANEAVFQTFHILNQFDIPIGTVRQLDEGVTYCDYTLATVVHDPINLNYYFRTYEDQTIQLVDLKTFKKANQVIKKMSTAGRQGFVDISRELKTVREQ